MAKMYPPIISEKLPAIKCLIRTDKPNYYNFIIPIEHNRGVNLDDIKHIRMKIKTLISNETLYETNVQLDFIRNKQIKFVSTSFDKLTVKQYYKIQLAYVNKDNEIGYWSTVGVAKCACPPKLTLGAGTDNIFSANENTINFSYGKLVGIISQQSEDPTEVLYSSYFTIGNYTSPEKIYNNESNTGTMGIEEIQFPFGLPEKYVYNVQFHGETISGLHISSSVYKVVNNCGFDLNFYANGIVNCNINEGYNSIDIHSAAAIYNGQFRISQNINEAFYFQEKDFENGILKANPYYNQLFLPGQESASIAYRAEADGRYYITGSNYETDNKELAFKFLEGDFQNDYLKFNNSYEKEDGDGETYYYAKNSFTNKYLMNYQEVNGLKGKFVIVRRTANTNWIDMKFLNLSMETEVIGAIKDFAIEQGIEYYYGIQEIYANGNRSEIIIINENEPAINDFEDMYLYDGERQLRIQFNPKVSNYKTVRKVQKQETIGGKYPVFYSNDIVNYKEFSIGGLISRLEDQEGLFWSPIIGYERNSTKEELKSNYYDNKFETSLVGSNFYLERKFREEVESWLNDNKPKLFKSSPEGNHIVRITDVSLTPNETVGRMIYEFTATATEIADCTDLNLVDQKFLGQDKADLSKTMLLDNYKLNEFFTVPFLHNVSCTSLTVKNATQGMRLKIRYNNNTIKQYFLGLTNGNIQTNNSSIYSIELYVQENLSAGPIVFEYTLDDVESRVGAEYGGQAIIIRWDYDKVSDLGGNGIRIPFKYNAEMILSSQDVPNNVLFCYHNKELIKIDSQESYSFSEGDYVYYKTSLEEGENILESLSTLVNTDIHYIELNYHSIQPDNEVYFNNEFLPIKDLYTTSYEDKIILPVDTNSIICEDENNGIVLSGSLVMPINKSINLTDGIWQNIERQEWGKDIKQRAKIFVNYLYNQGLEVKLNDQSIS